MSLSDCLYIVEDADRRELYYMNGLTLSQHLPELRGDFAAPQFLNPQWADDLHEWLGYTSRTICHFHSHHEAVLCQVTGIRDRQREIKARIAGRQPKYIRATVLDSSVPAAGWRRRRSVSLILAAIPPVRTLLTLSPAIVIAGVAALQHSDRMWLHIPTVPPSPDPVPAQVDASADLHGGIASPARSAQ